jgi:predicted anti-sigma-YlaC factor YlaD
MMLTLRRKSDLVCREVVEMVNDYLEAVMPRRDRRRFERHLRGCPNCTAYLEQMRVTITETGRLTPQDLTPDARAEFTRLYRRWHGTDPTGDRPEGDQDPDHD